MQRPTIEGVRIRTAEDAHVLFHAVALGRLPMVNRRLDAQERQYIRSGCAYVWERRNFNYAANSLGIERWTDSISWGPSRAKDDFLLYQERQSAGRSIALDSEGSDLSEPHATHSSGKRDLSRENLVKQTYSAYVQRENGEKVKWHLTCYYTERTLHRLKTVDDFPFLYAVQVPPGKYKPSRARAVPPHELGPFDPPHFTFKSGRSPSRSPPPEGRSELQLPPLQYAQHRTPARRHPTDEAALNSLPIVFM